MAQPERADGPRRQVTDGTAGAIGVKGAAGTSGAGPGIQERAGCVMLAAMSDSFSPSRVPAGATPEGDGVLIGDGPVLVDAYIDFLCPYCKQFELSSAKTLADLVTRRLASIAYHPMNFLDQASTTSYSTRAAAASGCAADRSRFTAYAHALFVYQPAEGGPGLSDTELAGLARAAAIDEAEFGACLSAGTYRDWPPYVTARAEAAGVDSTPTVLVAGSPVRPDPEAISAAVARAARAR
jgi:protein-disulfide isomerase